MSLADGTRKMSKSDASELSRISILDTNDAIATKIKKCKTDPTRGLEFGNPDRPDCNNLLTLYMLLSGQTQATVAAECAEMGWGQFKPLLTETTIAALSPIRDRYTDILAEAGYLDTVLREGREKAETLANATLSKVKKALGFAPMI